MYDQIDIMAKVVTSDLSCKNCGVVKSEHDTTEAKLFCPIKSKRGHFNKSMVFKYAKKRLNPLYKGKQLTFN